MYSRAPDTLIQPNIYERTKFCPHHSMPLEWDPRIAGTAHGPASEEGMQSVVSAMSGWGTQAYAALTTLQEKFDDIVPTGK